MTPTIEGNKLIAEFMGFFPRTDLHTEGALFMQAPISKGATHSSCYIVDKSLDKHDEFLELEYHTSWDWLMPVVEKIRNDHFIVIEIYGDFSVAEIIKDRDLPAPERTIYSEHKDSITAVYGAVIQFITWYKQQNPKQ